MQRGNSAGTQSPSTDRLMEQGTLESDVTTVDPGKRVKWFPVRRSGRKNPLLKVSPPILEMRKRREGENPSVMFALPASFNRDQN